MASLQDRFRDAVHFFENRPVDGPYRIRSKDRLTLNGLYKQAIKGNCDKPKPSMLQYNEAQKWIAWNGMRNMGRAEAMTHYIDLTDDLKINAEYRSGGRAEVPTGRFPSG